MKRFISISLFFLSFFKQKPNFTCYRLRRSFSSPSLVFFLLPPSLFCFIFPFRASPTRRIELEIAAAPGERGGGGHNGRARKERGRTNRKAKSRSNPLPKSLPLSSPLLDPRERASWPSPCSPRIGSEERKKKRRRKRKKNSATCEFRSRYLPISLFSILGSLGVLIMRRTLCRLS